ncbi:MAG: hypothetical protein GF381_00935 [Candidatus Pacebacteria bacterium]|nr:hypothetical protein [Candidatus Paceibacterota bacterium]
MAKIEQGIKGPFGGQMTEEGQQAYNAIVEQFAGQTEVTLDELRDFLGDELDVERPYLTLMFGAIQEMLQGLGFEFWMEETYQDTNKFGIIPDVPRWCGFRKVAK